MNFVAAWLFAHWKLNHTMYLAALLQLLGSWIRILSFMGDRGELWIMEVGTFIFCLANPLVLNAFTIIAKTWFGEL